MLWDAGFSVAIMQTTRAVRDSSICCYILKIWLGFHLESSQSS